MISAEEFSTRLPADVDDEAFDPSSTFLPPPSERSNISFFILKCQLVTCPFLNKILSLTALNFLHPKIFVPFVQVTRVSKNPSSAEIPGG